MASYIIFENETQTAINLGHKVLENFVYTHREINKSPTKKSSVFLHVVVPSSSRELANFLLNIFHQEKGHKKTLFVG